VPIADSSALAGLSDISLNVLISIISLAGFPNIQIIL